MDSQDLLNKFDTETRDNIARALWLKKFDAAELSDDVITKLASEENSNESFGKRMQYLLKDHLKNPDSYTPNYKRAYETLIKYSESLSPQQAYVMTLFLGMDSTRGYQEIPKEANFKFPADDAPQWNYQLGWHFIVGSCQSEKGNEYGIQYMFWQYALLPPVIAEQFGLTNIENQILELHLAISEAGVKHHRIKPVVIAGTTGLISYEDKPFTYKLGNNRMQSLRSDGTFPLNIKGYGCDYSTDSPSELMVDITLRQTKDYLLQGRKGCDPCCGGVGTLYYSVPNLRLDPDNSSIQIGEEKIVITGGKFWYDHQWCNGMLPAGNPRAKSVRIVNNLNVKPPGGWDWFMAQFDDDTELTLASIHTNEMRQYYEQTGPNPPGVMEVPVTGKYIDEKDDVKKVKGMLHVTEWIKSTFSQYPGLYRVTDTWYPNEWTFQFNENVPVDKNYFIMTPIVNTGQSGYFANGLHYSEGAVYLKDRDDNIIGRGFAESTGYADTLLNRLKLAGLPATNEMRDQIELPTPSKLLKLISTLYLVWPLNRRKLTRMLTNCMNTE